jgi:hypothetical protein
VHLTAKSTQKQWEELAAIVNEHPGTHKVWSLLLSLCMQHKVVMVPGFKIFDIDTHITHAMDWRQIGKQNPTPDSVND